MSGSVRRKDKPNFQVPNLERGLMILERLVDYEEGLRLSELASLMGFPPNSVMRIMNAMEYHGYVSRDPKTKKYMLSRKLFGLAYGSAREKSLVENSIDVMRKLRDELNETVVLSILTDGEGLVLEQIQAKHPFRFVCDPGTRQVLHASAACKVMLAFSSTQECDRVVKEIRFERLTPSTITSRKAYTAELKEVRKLGYAIDLSETLEGVHCVAAPILDHKGEAQAAITVTGPANRLKKSDFPGVGQLLKDACRVMSERNGAG